MEFCEQLFTALRHLLAVPERRPPAAPQARALRDHQRQGLQGGHAVKQLVDLEGAHHAAANTLIGRQRADVLAFQHDATGAWLQHAGEQVDEGGFAGAIGPDQRVACALFQVQVDAIGRHNAAKAHLQPLS